MRQKKRKISSKINKMFQIQVFRRQKSLNAAGQQINNKSDQGIQDS